MPYSHFNLIAIPIKLRLPMAYFTLDNGQLIEQYLLNKIYFGQLASFGIPIPTYILYSKAYSLNAILNSD